MKYALVSMPDHWQVHKHECRDALKLRAQGIRVDTVEAETAARLVSRELGLNESELRESGYDETCFRVMPCAGGAE